MTNDGLPIDGILWFSECESIIGVWFICEYNLWVFRLVEGGGIIELKFFAMDHIHVIKLMQSTTFLSETDRSVMLLSFLLNWVLEGNIY